MVHGMPVLVRAFRALCEGGWCPPYSLDVLGNAPPPPGLSLQQAMGEASLKVKRFPELALYYAKEFLLRPLESDFVRWEAHPLRTREEVLQLLQKAIRLAGGIPPSLPEPVRIPRRGGYVVTHGPLRRAS